MQRTDAWQGRLTGEYALRLSTHNHSSYHIYLVARFQCWTFTGIIVGIPTFPLILRSGMVNFEVGFPTFSDLFGRSYPPLAPV